MCLSEAWFINKMIRFAYLRKIGDDYKIILRRRRSSANCLSLTNSLRCAEVGFGNLPKKGDHVISSKMRAQKQVSTAKGVVEETHAARRPERFGDQLN